jgi:hypothetical protein
MLKIRIFLVFAIALGSAGLMGQEQEVINKDVKVVRAYTPSLSDAFKLNQMPELDDTSSFKPQFNYRILSKTLSTEYSVEPITPAKLAKRKQERLMNSYLRAGAGNYSTIFADLNYNIQQSESFVLGLNVGHFTSAAELKLENGNRVDAPLHDTWGNLNFRYLFDDKTVYTDLEFLHNIYHYYGQQNMSDGQNYVVPDYETVVGGDVLRTNKKQRLAGFNFLLGIKNNEIREDKLSYDTHFGFSSFGNFTGVSQNGFRLGGSSRMPAGDLNFDLDVEIDHYRLAVPDSINPLYTFEKRNNTLISATPRLVFNYDQARLNVGLLIAGEMDSFEDQFYIAPVLTGELTVAEGIISMFGGLNGRYNRNDYRTMQYENPFVSPDEHGKTAFYGLNLFAGIKGNMSAVTSFSADVSYAFFKDEHFYVNKYYQLDGSLNEFHYTNQFDVVHDDGKLLKVAGEFVFHPSETVELLVRGTYSGWQLDSLSNAWHKPDMELNFRGRFSPVDHLFIDASVNVYGKRFAFAPSSQMEQELEAVFDLNIGAEYHFSSRLNCFLQFNNLAAANYFKWYGYPSHGLNARAGVGWSF